MQDLALGALAGYMHTFNESQLSCCFSKCSVERCDSMPVLSTWAAGRSVQLPMGGATAIALTVTSQIPRGFRSSQIL